MSKLLEKYNWYESTIKWLLISSGLCPNDQKTSRALKVFLRICAAFFLYEVLVGNIFFSFEYGSNMNLLIRGMCFTLGLCVVLSKVNICYNKVFNESLQVKYNIYKKI